MNQRLTTKKVRQFSNTDVADVDSRLAVHGIVAARVAGFLSVVESRDTIIDKGPGNTALDENGIGDEAWETRVVMVLAERYSGHGAILLR